MWGGWYDRPEHMAFMKNTRNIAEEALYCSRASAAQVAVFIDEKAMLTHKAMDEAYKFRKALGLMGAAYDIYLVNDYEAVKERYDFCIFIEPTVTEPMTAAIEGCSCPHIIITKENCQISSAELRSLLKNAVIPLRSDGDAVVYETESHIFIGGTSQSLLYDGETETVLDGIGKMYRKKKTKRD